MGLFPGRWYGDRDGDLQKGARSVMGAGEICDQLGISVHFGCICLIGGGGDGFLIFFW